MKATDHGHTGFPQGYGKIIRPQDNFAGALRGAEEAKERLLQKLGIADRPYLRPYVLRRWDTQRCSPQ
jgi:hypothetical protein